MNNTHTASSIMDDFLTRFEGLVSGDIIGPVNNCKPPYGSEWEKEFEWVLSKGIPDNFTLENQYELCGCYFADFAMICNATGRVWLYEFDGKMYHNEERDNIRDQRIMSYHKEVQSLTRVDASTAKFNYDETRAMLGRLTPECFNKPLNYKGAEWVNDGETYKARKFNDSHCYDSWCDDEGNLMHDAPMVNLLITHKINPKTKL